MTEKAAWKIINPGTIYLCSGTHYAEEVRLLLGNCEQHKVYYSNLPEGTVVQTSRFPDAAEKDDPSPEGWEWMRARGSRSILVKEIRDD